MCTERDSLLKELEHVLEEHDFWCENCDICFKPSLQNDIAGERVWIVRKEFFPARDTGGAWSPVGSTTQYFSQCPLCNKETNVLF